MSSGIPNPGSDVNIVSLGKLKNLNIFYSHATNSSSPRPPSPAQGLARPLPPAADQPRPSSPYMNNSGQRQVQEIRYHSGGASIRLLNANNSNGRGRSVTPGLPSRPTSTGLRPPSAPSGSMNGSPAVISCMPSTSAVNCAMTNGQPQYQESSLYHHNGPVRPRLPGPGPGPPPPRLPTHNPPPGPLPPQSQAAQPEQMVRKCANFFSTLIKLSKQKADATKVVSLVQRVINGTISPNVFTAELQRELQSAAQPNLLPFLEKALPMLRQSLAFGQLTIEEIEPPRVNVVPSPSSTTSSAAPTPSSSMMMPNPMVHIPRLSMLPPHLHSAPSQPLQQPHERFREPDDDLNDVAAMGGVNLQEESQKILASTGELLQAETRPLPPGSQRLFARSPAIVTKLKNRLGGSGLTGVNPEVTRLICHAVQHKLSNIMERLSVISEHRMESFRGHPAYSQSDDVRHQLRAMEEAEKGQLQRREDKEKEMLYKISKSRSSNLEADQQERLRNKAKEMQKAEQDELRNKEANMAAAIALGGARKRTWAESSQAQEPVEEALDRPVISGRGGLSTSVRRPRVKRVNLRDLQFLLGQDRQTRRSGTLYSSLFS